MNDSSEEFEQHSPEKSLDVLSEQAAFLQDVATLIDQLPASKQANSENHSYTFFTRVLGDALFEVPATLKSVTPTIEAIAVTIGDAHIPDTYDNKDRPPYVSVDVNAGDVLYTFSRSGLEEDDSDTIAIHKMNLASYTHNEPSEAFSTRVENAGTLTKAELNTLLMGLALPNSLGDYSTFADKEVLLSTAFESLKELLAQRSDEHDETFSFVINEGESDIHFSKEHGQLTSFTLNYFDERQRTPISVEFDIDSELRLAFFAVEDGEKRVVIPTAHELNYVRQLLQQEIVASGGQPITPRDNEIPNEHDAELKARLLSNELNGLANDALKELGLDAPDTSA